jgi:uncharacterized iron-regulated membrane protein
MTLRISSALRARLRRAVFIIHLWLGLSVGLLFAVVSASGSAIVFRREMDAVQRPYLGYVSVPPGAKKLAIEDLQAKLRRDYPQAKPSDLNTLLFASSEKGAISTYVEGGMIAVDPYDGHTYAKISDGKSFAGWFKDLHVELLAGEKGEIVNGWAAVVSCLILLSGLWLWWPHTRRQIRMRLSVKRGVSLRRTLYDLHNALGFWTLAAVFIVTLTGAGLVFNQAVQKFVFAQTGTKRKPSPKIVPQGERRSPETLFQTALAAVPDGKPIFITVPTAPAQPFQAMFQRRGAGFFPYVTVKIDPYRGEIVDLDDDANATFGRKIMRQVAVLHFGIWGGTTSKVIYVLLGLAPVVLYGTGVYMWWQRTSSKRRKKARSA